MRGHQAKRQVTGKGSAIEEEEQSQAGDFRSRSLFSLTPQSLLVAEEMSRSRDCHRHINPPRTVLYDLHLEAQHEELSRTAGGWKPRGVSWGMARYGSCHALVPGGQVVVVVK